MSVEDSTHVAGDVQQSEAVECFSFRLAVPAAYRDCEGDVPTHGAIQNSIESNTRHPILAHIGDNASAVSTHDAFDAPSQNLSSSLFPSYRLSLVQNEDQPSETGTLRDSVPAEASVGLARSYPSYSLSIPVVSPISECNDFELYTRVDGTALPADCSVPTTQKVAYAQLVHRLEASDAAEDIQVDDDEIVVEFAAGTEAPVAVYAGKKYKKVANRTVPVSATLPEDFRMERRRPKNILIDMCPLPGRAPPFEPGTRYTQDRHDEFPLDPGGFLLPEELRLAEWIVRQNEDAFAWTEEERGSFSNEFFDPVRFPTVPHTPWVLKNIPIPHGIFTKVCDIIKTKIDAGVYEPSNSSYRSRWFCVVKKDGQSLRLVHDLRPLNEVTIRDVAALPLIEDIVERAAGKACYTGLDLLVAFDQRELHQDSRDLTTFQTPFGAHRLTAMPMGYTNSVAILQGDVSFIYQFEIPHVINPFADDCNMNGPSTRYERPDGGVEMVPWNLGIRRFIWEHFVNVHRCLHIMKRFGGTFSGKKLYFCVPELEILGHTVHYGGKSADKNKVQKIADWPRCRSLTEVRAFLGTCGLVRMYVKNFSQIARPLVELTKKDVPFEWTEAQDRSMDAIKECVLAAPALAPIDYSSDREVILAVDSSYLAVGFVLYQVDAKGKRRPARFGSITWNERESRYSQAKIELYGLYRAVRAWRIYLVGVRNLVVEVDALYIKDMLHNPDLVPSAAVNRWIAGILLFNFQLRHVAGTSHTAADGLSRRPRADSEPIDDPDEAEDFVDRAYSFAMEVHNPVDPTPLHAMIHGVPHTLAHEAMLEPVTTNLALPAASSRIEKAERRLRDIELYFKNKEVPAGLGERQVRDFAREVNKYFLREGKLWRKHPDGRHTQYVIRGRRLAVLKNAHDDLGHKGKFAVRQRIATRFWWPGLDSDITWYLRTCHECQLRQLTKVYAPPIPIEPAVLFFRFHIDTMMLPAIGKSGMRHCVQARESLSAWPEARGLTSENAQALSRFIFENILCRWGAIAELITDNGPAFVKAADELEHSYGVRGIRISGYNSRANGVVERRHRDLRESLVKLLGPTCKGWRNVLPEMLWAERVTAVKATGLSPYQMVTGQEPTLPFDITEATWLVDGLDAMPTDDLIAIRTRQLQRRESDLAMIRERVTKARLQSIEAFEKLYARQIHDYDFQPGALVLVRNKRVEMELDRKTKPRYFGPMIVVSRGRNGAYRLAELDSTLSQNEYAAFRVIPYHARAVSSVRFTHDSGLDSTTVTDIPAALARIRDAIPNWAGFPTDGAEDESSDGSSEQDDASADSGDDSDDDAGPRYRTRAQAAAVGKQVATDTTPVPSPPTRMQLRPRKPKTS